MGYGRNVRSHARLNALLAVHVRTYVFVCCVGVRAEHTSACTIEHVACSSCTYVCTYVCAYVCTYVRLGTYVYVSTYVRTYVFVCCVGLRTERKFACTIERVAYSSRTYVRTYSCVAREFARTYVRMSGYVRTYVRTMYVRLGTYVRTYM